MQTSIMIKEQFVLQVSGILITSEEIQEIMLKGGENLHLALQTDGQDRGPD